MPRRKKLDDGNILEIELPDGSFSYGVIIKDPLVAFSSLNFSERVIPSIEIFENVSFKLWVMSSAIGKKGWAVVGNISVTKLNMVEPIFYRFDSISKQFFRYVDCVNDIPTTMENCVGLECAAVWSKEHIESRLLSFKNRTECKWEKSLRAENRA